MKAGNRKNTAAKVFLIIMAVALILCIGMLVIKEKYTVTSVNVVGNTHYTTQQIEDMIMSKPYERNSLYLNLKYHNKSIEDIPFVQKMDVEILSPQSIRINVYEKAVAGYVEYLGHYMYFDKDGIVVESSSETTPGVPFVTGLNFDHVVLHKELPVEDTSVFMSILNITQLLNKYDIMTDRISFDTKGKITLYFGEAHVFLGSSDYIDEKINEMHLLLPKLEGYSGTLHMENYTGEDVSFSFIKDSGSAEVVNLEIGDDAESADEEAEEAEEAAPESEEMN